MGERARPNVRLATRVDAEALADLHLATVTVAYRAIFPPDSTPPSTEQLIAEYEAMLTNPQTTVWVIDGGSSDGRLDGSIALVADAAVTSGWRLEKFNVRPACQGFGFARVLYRELIAAARDRQLPALHLWVLDDNAFARTIYERWGWEHVPGQVLVNEPTDVIDVLYELNLEVGVRHAARVD